MSRTLTTALVAACVVAAAAPAVADDLDRVDVSDCAVTAHIDPSAESYRAGIISALGVVSAATGIAFTEVTEGADLEYVATDLSAFGFASADGSTPLGIYALGRVTLGAAETTERGRSFITLHETGHALGLHHSDDLTDIMYPFFYGQRTRMTGMLGELVAIGHANGCRP